MERTFIAVKPDGVQRGLCGDIIKRFEQRGFRLVAAKFMQVETEENTVWFEWIHVTYKNLVFLDVNHCVFDP